MLGDRRGFSMGEMLVVVAILGIIAALAVPRLDWTRYRINSEVRNVSMQLGYSQRLAVSLQHNVLVTVDGVNRRLSVDEDKDNDDIFEPGAGERRRVVQLDLGLNFARNSAPDLPAPSPANELTSIIYRRDGSASTAGVIFMNTDRGVAAGNNQDARVLEITRASGRATWYSYTSGTWKRGS